MSATENKYGPLPSEWLIARRYCPRCRRTFGVVLAVDASDLTCPRCDGPVEESNGKDDEQ